jgi:formamidopyrimidine-DNA glycosylase
MPELPEVETTVRGLNKRVKNLTIKDVWTDSYSEFHQGKPNIKDRAFFKKFRRAVTGRKILGAARRAKNVLIHLNGGITILIHLKMTGHLLYGRYRFQKGKWEPTENGPLKDPMNRFVHAVFTLSNSKSLALSDLRKFAKVTFEKTADLETAPDLKNLGPEPLDPGFNLKKFSERLGLKPNGKIKQVLMDQEILAGIGNIYSDEILWQADVQPLAKVKNIPLSKLKLMYAAMKKVLRRSIKIGGDSETDYRNVDGKIGGYQNITKAYGREGEKCSRPRCPGVIRRIKIGGRSAHFCPIHQIKY